MISYEPGIAGTYCYLRDERNNVAPLMDENGDVVESYMYDPYGQAYVWQDSIAGEPDIVSTDPLWDDSLTPSAYGNPYGFTGHRFTVAGLYETPFRAYSPTLGRWLQRDPLGYRYTFSLYNYVCGNPNCWYDPLGLWTFGFGWGISLNIGVVNFQWEGFVHFGFSGEKGISVGLLLGGASGPALGAGVSLGPILTVTDAESVEDLLGEGVEVGVDTPLGNLSAVGGVDEDYTGFQVSPPGLHAGGAVRAGSTITGGVGVKWKPWENRKSGRKKPTLRPPGPPPPRDYELDPPKPGDPGFEPVQPPLPPEPPDSEGDNMPDDLPDDYEGDPTHA